MPRKKYASIDEFIADFDGETRTRLEMLRKVIREALPKTATEKISYNIPAFTLNGKGYLVYFAGYVHHTSLYPVPPSVPASFQKEIDVYQKGKGTLQFANSEPLPLDFIRRVVHYLLDDYQIRNKE